MSLTLAIAQLETGGTLNCDKVGQSGEHGCFQFLPNTWVAYSTDVFGYVAEHTPANAEHVAKEKIYKWIEQGKTDREIFLTWNQGNAGPCKKGVNKFGVKYNSCAYADEGLRLLKEQLQ